MKRSIWHHSYDLLREQLLNMRLAKGLTQVELSKILNKPQSFVSKYENGDRNLDVIELINICEACNTNPSIFIDNLNQKLSK